MFVENAHKFKLHALIQFLQFVLELPNLYKKKTTFLYIN